MKRCSVRRSIPYQPPGLWVDVSFAQFEYTTSTGKDLYRRGLYTFFRRTLAPPNMFDNANRQACTVKDVADQHAVAGIDDAQRPGVC